MSCSTHPRFNSLWKKKPHSSHSYTTLLLSPIKGKITRAKELFLEISCNLSLVNVWSICILILHGSCKCLEIKGVTSGTGSPGRKYLSYIKADPGSSESRDPVQSFPYACLIFEGRTGRLITLLSSVYNLQSRQCCIGPQSPILSLQLR